MAIIFYHKIDFAIALKAGYDTKRLIRKAERQEKIH